MEGRLTKFIDYSGRFILALLIGFLVVLIGSAAGAPDIITFPGALLVTLGLFALCVRLYTPGPRRRAAGRTFGIRLYTVGPSPSVEDVAAQLAEGARKRRRGRPRPKRQRPHGKPRHHHW